MRAGWIELAHDADPPVRVGLPEVAQEILDDDFRPAVDARGMQRLLLAHPREIVALAIDARRGAEYERRDTRLAHHSDQCQRAPDVDIVVGETTRLGLGDILERGA